MTKTTKRFLALAVSVMMVVALLPLAVFAATAEAFEVTVSKVAAFAADWTNVGTDGVDHADKSQANQSKITVVQDAAKITITANLSELAKFASSNSDQGEGKWIAIQITGADTLTGAMFGSHTITADDIAADKAAGADDNSIILWLKAEEANGRTFTLTSDDPKESTYTITVVDTTPVIPPQVVQPTTPQTVPAVGTPGVAVSGNLSAGASVTATETSLATVAPAAGAQFAVALTGGEKTLLGITEVKLTGTFNGKLSVTLPVDAQYNGQTVTVLHYTSAGRLETYTAVVVNGAVTVEVASLSPFAVLIDTKLVGDDGADVEEGTPEDELPGEDDTDIDEIPDDDGDDIVDEGEEPAKTGDFATGSALAIAAIIAAAAALAFVSKKARSN